MTSSEIRRDLALDVDLDEVLSSAGILEELDQDLRNTTAQQNSFRSGNYQSIR